MTSPERGEARWLLPESFASSAGVVRWVRLGGPGGDPVILLHGTPFSSYVWRAIAAALERRRAVYAWDMPGYGQSEQVDGQDVSLQHQGLVFTELLGHWGLTEPAVVAHDIGGAVALRAHLLHAARFRRLALIDPVAVAPWGSPFFRLVRDHADVFTQLPPTLHRALVRAYVESASHRGLRSDVLDQLSEPWLSEAGQPAFYRQIAQADERATDEIQPLYGRIDIPVLVGWGTEDRWIPPARGQELVEAIGAHARLHRFAGAGHLVQEDAPAELTAALLEFLAT